MNLDAVLAQQAVSGSLVSWWKMILMIPPFVGWAWIIARVIAIDAQMYRLNAPLWNAIQMLAGIGALAAMLFIPIFWISWPIGVCVLITPILIYWRIRNEAVPEERRFFLTGQSLQARVSQRRLARAAKQAAIRFTDSEGKSRNPPLKDDPLFPIHMMTEDILGPAISARASRVELLIGKSGAVIAHTIDGVRTKQNSIPTDESMRVADYLKDLAGLDTADRRRRQFGQFELLQEEGLTEITLITAGSSSGINVQLDFDLSKRLIKPFDGLGLLDAQLESLQAFIQPHDRHGLIMIGAPSSNGLTTSAYSFVSRHDAYTSNVKTLEREVTVPLDGVDQVIWDASNPNVDYATNLQSILRRDPDIVLTDEILDRETAQTAAEPGIQGPLIYIQQSLPTIVDQIRDWVRKVGDVKEATRAIRAVTNQRLLRTLCPNCRQPYQPTAEQLKKLNLSGKKVTQLYRASGKVQIKNRIETCPVCKGTGYLGQTAAFEVLIINDEAKKLLSAGDLKATLAAARRNNMIYMLEAALSKVVSGETSVDEVARVTSQDAKQKPAKART